MGGTVGNGHHVIFFEEAEDARTKWSFELNKTLPKISYEVQDDKKWINPDLPQKIRCVA